MTTETTLSAGSDLLATLATITNRDESGRHFTERYSDEVLAALESQGLISIRRPIHEATGISFDRSYWFLSVTDLGIETVEALYDERDYSAE